MNDLISRQDAIDEANAWFLDCFKVQKQDRSCGLIRRLEDLPTADVAPVVHGEWFPIDVGDCCYRCSVCDFVRDAYLLEEDKYCPHCGAKMDL